MAKYIIGLKKGADLETAPSEIKQIIESVLTDLENAPEWIYEVEEVIQLLRKNGLPESYQLADTWEVKFQFPQDFFEDHRIAWPLVGPLQNGRQGIIAEVCRYNEWSSPLSGY